MDITAESIFEFGNGIDSEFRGYADITVNAKDAIVVPKRLNSVRIFQRIFNGINLILKTLVKAIENKTREACHVAGLQ